MCSVFDIIDKQKYLIESKRKTIQTLYEFLDSVDKSIDEKTETNGDKKEFYSKHKNVETNGLSNGNYVSDKKIVVKDLPMIQTNGILSWIDSEKGEQKRRQLGEERRKEYNDFLQLKSRNSERISRRVMEVIPDYSDILNKKRIEERKLRQSNGYDIEDVEDINEVIIKRPQKKTFPELPTVGWFHCSNNKYDQEHITPRSRLLATHSSRLRAAKYREELRKQVEEKERLRAQERERRRREEEQLERKLEAQRIKLLEEYESEHKLIKQKQISDELNKQLVNRDLKTGTTSPLSLLRSPSYMHTRESQPLNPVPRKSSAVSRSLNSALSQTIRTSHSMATQTSDEQKHLTSEEESDYDSPIPSEEEDTEDEDQEEEDRRFSKEAEFRRRVLSQLSEVRQMMESDHVKMMEQLRQQQLSQLDE